MIDLPYNPENLDKETAEAAPAHWVTDELCCKIRGIGPEEYKTSGGAIEKKYQVSRRAEAARQARNWLDELYRNRGVTIIQHRPESDHCQVGISDEVFAEGGDTMVATARLILYLYVTNELEEQDA